MSTTQFWKQERFPIIYEAGEVKAVLVEVASFAQIEMILDNLFPSRNPAPKQRHGQPVTVSVALHHF